mgnify:CR=1 FL=1
MIKKYAICYNQSMKNSEAVMSELKQLLLEHEINAEVLDIEIASQTKDDSTFDVSNLAHYQLEQGNPINLKNDGSGDLHVVQYGLTINMDKTASDYSKVSANIEASTAMIYDMARNIIGSYTYTEVIDGETTTNKIKEELLKQLKETFNTECIYSVSFYNWVAQ